MLLVQVFRKRIRLAAVPEKAVKLTHWDWRVSHGDYGCQYQDSAGTTAQLILSSALAASESVDSFQHLPTAANASLRSCA